MVQRVFQGANNLGTRDFEQDMWDVRPSLGSSTTAYGLAIPFSIKKVSISTTTTTYYSLWNFGDFDGIQYYFYMYLMSDSSYPNKLHFNCNIYDNGTYSGTYKGQLNEDNDYAVVFWISKYATGGVWSIQVHDLTIQACIGTGTSRTMNNRTLTQWKLSYREYGSYSTPLNNAIVDWSNPVATCNAWYTDTTPQAIYEGDPTNYEELGVPYNKTVNLSEMFNLV